MSNDRIKFFFIDATDKNKEVHDGFHYDADDKFRRIVGDGSEAFGYESGAAVYGTRNDNSLGPGDFIHPNLTAAQVATKYGTTILIHPREDNKDGNYHIYLGDPMMSDQDDDDE